MTRCRRRSTVGTMCYWCALVAALLCHSLWKVAASSVSSSETSLNTSLPETVCAAGQNGVLVYEAKNVERYEILEHILASNYSGLDSTLDESVRELKQRGGHRCWHKHSTFLQHLLGVHHMLRLWGQGTTMARVGLLHSAYSNSYVNLALFDPETERQVMQTMVGTHAEELIYLYCVIDRQNIVVNTLSHHGIVPPDGLHVPHLRNSTISVHLSAETLQKLLIFTMADIADQYFGWQDVLFGGNNDSQTSSMLLPRTDNPNNHDSMALWPGVSKPGLWMSYVSRLGTIANTLQPHTHDLPPVFDHCTKTLTREDETKARDLYWSVIIMEHNNGSHEEVIALLEKCVMYNPWAFEPLVLLAQKFLHLNKFKQAREALEHALELQMMWGTAWDKRMSFDAWVAWTRVLYQQAASNTPWPTNSWEVNNFGLVY